MSELSEQEIGMQIVEASTLVFQELGPGLIKKVYAGVFEMELEERGLKVETNIPVTIRHRGRTFADAFRADMIVEDRFIIDITADEEPRPGRDRRLLTFLRYTRLQYGYNLNFGNYLHRERVTHVPRRVNDPILLQSRGIASAKGHVQPQVKRHRLKDLINGGADAGHDDAADTNVRPPNSNRKRDIPVPQNGSHDHVNGHDDAADRNVRPPVNGHNGHAHTL